MGILQFEPRRPYTILPRKWTYRFSLGMMLRWPDLRSVVRFAQERRGYGDTDSGVGIEYPVRADRQGLVRMWRWNWHAKGRIRTRKFHFPEADYLGTLAALLRAKEWLNEAEAIAKIMPLADVVLVRAPDPYDISNYSFREFTPEIRHGIRFVLEQWSFQRATERAATREGFTLDDGCSLSYLPNGSLMLHLPHGRTLPISEETYMTLLQEARHVAAPACAKLEKVLAKQDSCDEPSFGV